MRKRVIALAAGALAVSSLSACDGTGQLNLAERFNLGGKAEDETGALPAAGTTVEEDVEAPEVFSVNEEGLWDGRPSLGGIWVAHPDVTDPERVIIRNIETGQSVVGALFRRERDMPGPRLQVSSDAATELSLVAGVPQELSVIALRRQEVPADATDAEEDAVSAPPAVSESTLDPAAIEKAIGNAPDPQASLPNSPTARTVATADPVAAAFVETNGGTVVEIGNNLNRVSPVDTFVSAGFDNGRHVDN